MESIKPLRPHSHPFSAPTSHPQPLCTLRWLALLNHRVVGFRSWLPKKGRMGGNPYSTLKPESFYFHCWSLSESFTSFGAVNSGFPLIYQLSTGFHLSSLKMSFSEMSLLFLPGHRSLRILSHPMPSASRSHCLALTPHWTYIDADCLLHPPTLSVKVSTNPGQQNL
jgi:hypothetical protein